MNKRGASVEWRNRRIRRTACPCAISSTINITWTGLGLNPLLVGERLDNISSLLLSRLSPTHRLISRFDPAQGFAFIRRSAFCGMHTDDSCIVSSPVSHTINTYKRKRSLIGVVRRLSGEWRRYMCSVLYPQVLLLFCLLCALDVRHTATRQNGAHFQVSMACWFGGHPWQFRCHLRESFSSIYRLWYKGVLQLHKPAQHKIRY